MEIWELTAREQVRDNLATNTHMGDRGDLDAVIETYTEDAVLDIPGRDPLEGRDAIRAVLSRSADRESTLHAQGRRFLRHFVASLRFDEVTSERIVTSAYFMVVTPAGPDHWGRYRDVHTRVGDEWRIAHSEGADRHEGRRLVPLRLRQDLHNPLTAAMTGHPRRPTDETIEEHHDDTGRPYRAHVRRKPRHRPRDRAARGA
jgi:hypothetical protein